MSRSLTSGAWRSVIAVLVFAEAVSVSTRMSRWGRGRRSLITKTDGVANAVAGGSVVYTITASDARPTTPSRRPSLTRSRRR